MDGRDEELDEILAPLRGETPTELELRRWERALARAAASGGSTRPRWLAVAAAALVGAVLGGTLATTLKPATPCEPDDARQYVAALAPMDATDERIHVKLD